MSNNYISQLNRPTSSGVNHGSGVIAQPSGGQGASKSGTSHYNHNSQYRPSANSGINMNNFRNTTGQAQQSQQPAKSYATSGHAPAGFAPGQQISQEQLQEQI